jgi:hypothetical protein
LHRIRRIRGNQNGFASCIECKGLSEVTSSGSSRPVNESIALALSSTLLCTYLRTISQTRLDYHGKGTTVSRLFAQIIPNRTKTPYPTNVLFTAHTTIIRLNVLALTNSQLRSTGTMPQAPDDLLIVAMALRVAAMVHTSLAPLGNL